MRFASLSGLATRRRTNVWLVVVCRWMSPIWIRAISRKEYLRRHGPWLGRRLAALQVGFVDQRQQAGEFGQVIQGLP